MAGSIATLWWAMAIGAAVLFVLVMGMFAFATLRPGWTASTPASRWIIWGGLVLPALVLPPLVGWALVAGERLLPAPGTDVPRVEVEAFNWGWTFRYPEAGGASSEGVLHLPAGVAVDLHITSRDVIHSFWVPRLAGKLDAIPGRINVLRLRADRPGHHRGVCAEFCGLEHAMMGFDVRVHTPAAYAAALAELEAE